MAVFQISSLGMRLRSSRMRTGLIYFMASRTQFKQVNRTPVTEMKWTEITADWQIVWMASWDNESPKQEVVVEAFRIKWRPVTNGKFFQFYQEYHSSRSRAKSKSKFVLPCQLGYLGSRRDSSTHVVRTDSDEDSLGLARRYLVVRQLICVCYRWGGTSSHWTGASRVPGYVVVQMCT